MRKHKMKRILGFVLVLVLIVSCMSQVRDPTIVYADNADMMQTEQVGSTKDKAADDTNVDDAAGAPKEETEEIQDTVDGEENAEEGNAVHDSSNQTTSDQTTSNSEEEQNDSSEAKQEIEVQEEQAEANTLVGDTPFDVNTTTGANLYRGAVPDQANYLGTYASWTTLLAAIKTLDADTYSIDLYDTDISISGTWYTKSTSGTDQFYLNFYSSTYAATSKGSVTFAASTIMGAHMQFHSGVKLQMPSSTYTGAPLSSGNGAGTVNYPAQGAVYANGWKFIVDKGVDVSGYAQLYASGNVTTNFLAGKTVLEENGQQISSGYIEVNSGTWRTLAGAYGDASGAYRVKVGTNDDPENPVNVDTVFGRVNYSTMRPVTPDPVNIPTEYLQVSGNTIIKYGVGMMPAIGYFATASGYSKIYTTQKVELSGNVTVVSTLGGVTRESVEALSDTVRNSYNRISVSAGSTMNGQGHYTGNTDIVNVIVDISDDVYVAGDVIGNGPNMYFNVNGESEGVHISIKDRAQIGGNIVYGGSSSAGAVKPTNDSADHPFFTIDIIGADKNNGVKIGGSLLATNGEDNDANSKYSVATTVKNATVNGSIFAYGNLSYQSYSTGISIRSAAVIVTDSTIGGGVYGVATGSSGASTETININISGSIVGHVAPFFTRYANSSNYKINKSNVEIKNSVITGRTVMWTDNYDATEAYNLPTYAFVGENTPTNLKAMAAITVNADGTRTIDFSTDGYQGVELSTTKPDVSLTTSMTRNAIGNYTIKLATDANYKGNHTISIANTDFERTNGNPTVAIMDTGDGTLGESATVTIDNCHAITAGRKIDASIFGTLTDEVTTTKMGQMSMEVKNTNDVGNVGFVNAGSSYYINTKASITLENTVIDSLFGKKGSEAALRNDHSSVNRLQFLFKGNNTIGEVLANGADIVFDVDSSSYISGKFNNTSATVFDDEWVDVKEGSKVFLGGTGTVAAKESIGDASVQRIFGSIQGTNGEVYIYKDTSDLISTPNATYPIYVAQNGSILSDGMGLGEWTSSDGSIETIDKTTELSASTGLNKEYTIQLPEISKTSSKIQKEHDILIAFGTLANAKATQFYDVPLRPWPLINYNEANVIGATDEKNGWLILGAPRYQVIFKGTGYFEEDGTTKAVAGSVKLDADEAESITRPGDTEYLYTKQDPYDIEDILAVPDNPGYEFLHWALYSAKEEEDSNGIIIKDQWIPAAEILSSINPSENIWNAGDQIDLMEFLKADRLDKNESKVLMLIPVYKPNYVCKIGDTGYLTLADAFAAIEDDSATSESDNSYKIQMLVEEYEIKTLHTVSDGKNIAITTASTEDAELPYLGTPGTNSVLKRQYVDETSQYKGAFFQVNGVSGVLNIQNLVLDGNKDNVTSEAALIKLDASASLNLGTGSELKNNKTTSEGAAVEGSGDNPILLEDTVISGNVSTSAAGGGIVPGGTSDISLKGKVVVTNNSRDTGAIQETSNIALEEDGKVNILGSLSADSSIGIRVVEVNHDNGYVFAAAEDENGAEASYPFFQDDYMEALGIVLNPLDLTQIQFRKAENFLFTKVKAEDTDTPLNGAEFKLYVLNCEDESHNHGDPADLVSQESIDAGCWSEFSSDTSGGTDKADGLVNMGDLTEGTYMLVETATVSNYQLPEGQWQIDVKPSAVNKITITAHEANGKMPPAFMIEIADDGSTAYKLPNIKLFELPLSGMPGVMKFLVIGGTILTLTTLLYILRKRRDDRLGSE